MEKMIYLLWREPEQTPDEFSARLQGPVARDLTELGALGIQVNVADSDVANAVMRIATVDPQLDALISLWVDTATDAARRPIEDTLHTSASRIEGYLVTESEPLLNASHPAAPGERTHGLANVALIRRPADLAYDDWLERWLTDHTPVAIETQNTFGYVQNVVVRPLTEVSTQIDGIVEELFPPAAIDDFTAFFDDSDGEDGVRRNMEIMTESTAAFGASSNLDLIPTSRYVLTHPFGDR